MEYIRILNLCYKIIFHMLRWFCLIVGVILFLFTFYELFSFNTDYFYRWNGADSWNYHNAEYYHIGSVISVISSAIVIVASIFANKVPKWCYIAFVFAMYGLAWMMNWVYNADNPPEWIFNIFQ